MSSSINFKPVVDLAAQPYVQAGKFAWHWAKGKLGGDPAFAHILRLGLIRDNDNVIDIGCGQGLFASCLWAAEQQQARGLWFQGWAAAPKNVKVHGIELMQSDVDRANEALKNVAKLASFECEDMCKAKFEPCNVVVILDVLHYVNFDNQNDVLDRIAKALRQGGTATAKGKLLLRVGDASAGLPFKISNWVDHVVTFARGHRLPRLYCRSVKEWTQSLSAIGFSVQPMAMHEGTPFANIMLICELQ
jgi:cyclopropane fatty-acyl-phospholipid synthase-like methyltransferase